MITGNWQIGGNQPSTSTKGRGLGVQTLREMLKIGYLSSTFLALSRHLMVKKWPGFHCSVSIEAIEQEIGAEMRSDPK